MAFVHVEFIEKGGSKIKILVRGGEGLCYFVDNELCVAYITDVTRDEHYLKFGGRQEGKWSLTAGPGDEGERNRCYSNVEKLLREVKDHKVCGFADTDGDSIVFRHNGRYLDYWVNSKLILKNVSKLTSNGNTLHYEGTPTGSEGRSRTCTLPAKLSYADDIIKTVKGYFSTRPTFGALCIGSAGHGKGTAKGGANAKDSAGALDTKDDIEDCKKYMMQQSSSYEFYGAYEVAGLVGSADGCKGVLRTFFGYCKEKKIAPVIYYTGHGDSDGDWCFPGGGYISYTALKDLNVSGWKMTIWADCCYSGQWAKKAKGDCRVLAASNCTKKAINRVFARAVFNGSKADQDKLWSGDIDAISADFDSQQTPYFRGNCGPVPKKD